jgi:hypothetical protein
LIVSDTRSGGLTAFAASVRLARKSQSQYMAKGAIFEMAYEIYGAEKRFNQILMTFFGNGDVWKICRILEGGTRAHPRELAAKVRTLESAQIAMFLPVSHRSKRKSFNPVGV